MRKANYLLAIAGVALLAMTGCGKVTAEDLVNGLSKIGEEKVADANLAMNMDMDYAIDGESTSKMTMAMDVRMQTNDTVAYADGNMSMSILGMDIDQPVKSWVDFENNKTYTYDADADQWTESAEAENLKLFAGDFSTDIFKDLQMVDVEKGEDYKVTAKVDYEALQKILGDSEVASGMDLVEEAEGMDMDITMTFGRKDKMLKTMRFDIDPSGMEGMEDAKVNEFNIIITYHQIGGKLDLTIPDSVK